MYKMLLCWRYLRTRYIALASVVSVMLGVATMIVVNSVMAGFSNEMQVRIKGILSDVVFETHSFDGFHDPEDHMRRIREVAGQYIAGMTPTVHVPAMLSFQYGGQYMTRPVQIVGIDVETKDQAGVFAEYLNHAENRKKPSWDLRTEGYDTYDHQGSSDSPERAELGVSGWRYRAWKFRRERLLREAKEDATVDPQDQAQAGATGFVEANPFIARPTEKKFDPELQQHIGCVVGYGLSTYRGRSGRDHFMLRPGDDLQLTMPTSGSPPKAIDDSFTVVDLYESKMNEYDTSFVFVPIKHLQKLRGMIDPQTGIGNVNSIQIKLKDSSQADLVRDLLRDHFSPAVYGIYTWKDKQGPLLAAVQMETAILNVLLFMIVAVAGFGILAIFFMIVVEKTRDIGILKSLGASSRGIMGIFLGYGVSLGVVGSGVGMMIGLLFVAYINEIADLLSKVTGQQVFDPTIYYFLKIPTIVNPFTITWIVIGAVMIAVMASVLPARRAALLHPVEALRHD